MNYYIKLKDRKVNQPDLHIGKVSAGWEFCFMSYEADDFYSTPELKNKKQWFEYMFLHDDLIVDENDQPVSFSTITKIVNDSKGDKLKNMFDELMKENGIPFTYYKDEEGYIFDTTQFS